MVGLIVLVKMLNQMSYDQQYSKVEALFGTKHESILELFIEPLKPGSLLLDIGAGQGRNTLFLAKQGFHIHALEPSNVAVNALKQVAQEEHLPIELYCMGFEQFEPPAESYDGILIFGLIPDLTFTAIRELVLKVDNWSKKNTILWVTGFTTQDPAYDNYKKTFKTLEPNSFQSTEGQVRTYLNPSQILELFENFTVLYHWEGLGPEHQHGDDPPERHGKFEAVFVKEKS
jgi:cyclopropane fatty-acyl-phospholipid synthase-like methyltransferase